MKAEEKLATFIHETRMGDIPPAALKTVKHQILAVLGTTIAGATAEGCETAVQLYRELGGKQEATILVHGGRIPAQDAAFVNGIMARALDFCDSMAPGPHPGSAVIPAALAASELAGGCSGTDFITAVAIGTEVAARLNLSEAAYDGFDPTGICVPFGAAAAAARILGLNRKEIGNALALAFNSCGGSFQSHIDGSLGVRFVQGRVAQSGVMSARLASKGITGPGNFLDGIYGYYHLYGKDTLNGETALTDLGSRYHLLKLVFKKYPSCALTAGSTDITLRLILEEGLEADGIERIDITVPPYAYKLVGHPFEIGDNPKVNAQFSIQYCVANALMRKSSKLSHFEEDSIKDPGIAALVERINVIEEKALEARGHTPLDMRVVTRSGKEYFRTMDIAPGFPGNELTREDHEERFWDCIDFAAKPIDRQNAEKIIDLVGKIEAIDDIRILIPLLAAQD
ncbi:MAG: MmgE/PrpD family protein [Deltaproteobacteria bacterium RBG_13_52_11b]|nr:MAG: MmgE/PrpD family protein [Deltaproteobacteria bacterium RBG_13_52_11b]